MASTYSPQGTAQLLEHAPTEEPLRHRVPRQARAGSPVLGVTAMAAALGATGLTAAPAVAAAMPATPPAASSPSASDEASAADPGLALAARIQQQADHRRTAAEEAARLEAAHEAAAKRAAQAEAAARAAAEAASPTSFAAPVSKYTLSAQYGQDGGHWAHLHTGLDFTAALGTPVTALGQGTVTSAGWSGSYGYRVTQTLPDGTEVWYCHLSSIAVTGGEVAPGTVLGKVGATGNATGPRLHLEIRPDGGAPVDPLAWLRARGVNP